MITEAEKKYSPRVKIKKSQRQEGIYTYMGSRGIVPYILNFCCTWRSVVKFTSRHLYFSKESPVLSEKELVWAPESGWVFMRKETCLASAGIRIPDSTSRNQVTIPTQISGFPH
jgi:hypothetical protein